MRRARWGAAVVLGLLAACVGRGGDGGQQLVVQAAASLTDVFAELADDFETANPEVAVALNVAGSQSLATQLLEGAAADVFASADSAQMQRVADEGLLRSPPTDFATNRLTIAVEAGNPLGVTDLEDLADPTVVVVLAAPDVPAGALASQVLQRAGVALTPASLELDVRAALSKVALGEADAALVYTTDVVAADGAVEAVAITQPDALVNRYPIAVLAGAAHPDTAQAFVDLVTGSEGQQVLAAHGFGSP